MRAQSDRLAHSTRTIFSCNAEYHRLPLLLSRITKQAGRGLTGRRDREQIVDKLISRHETRKTARTEAILQESPGCSKRPSSEAAASEEAKRTQSRTLSL